MSADESIFNLVREQEESYLSGKTIKSKYVSINQYDTINRIDAYLSSKHISGELDSLGREKPFFNIVTAAVNAWFRATDIDTKNINPRATKDSAVLQALIAKSLLAEYFRKENFGVFLNKWGRMLAQYGSSICEFTENDSGLHADTLPWQKVICDPICFDDAPLIKKLYLTKAKLQQNKSYNQEVVKQLLEDLSARKTLDGVQIDSKSDYIEVYEVHGQLPLSYLTDRDEDDDPYVEQMHVISFFEENTTKGDIVYNDYCLYKGRKEKQTQMITHLIEEEGQTLSIGAVQHLFDAQWMSNHNAKLIKDQLDIASKIIFQTSNMALIGQNVLSAAEVGDILVHPLNEPLTQLNNQSHDVTQMQNAMNMWKAVAQEIVSTPDSLLGNAAPSGTAWRQVEALQGEAHSLFELMTENKGLYLSRMIKEYILPYLMKTKMKTKEQIVAFVEDNGIKSIDVLYIPNEAARRYNQKLIDALLNDKSIDGMSVEAEQQAIQKELSALGGQRFLKPSSLDDKTWKEIINNFDDIEIDITGESRDTQEALTTLTTILKTVANDPAKFNFIFNKILEESNTVSPIEMGNITSQQNQQPQAQPVGGA